MTGHNRRTCYRRGNWWFRVGLLCCALLISLSIAIIAVRAAPLTRVGAPGEVSYALTHKWLAGKMAVGLTPPKGSTEMQKTEWNIGVIVALADECGYRRQAKEVHAYMKKSPYYKIGHSDVTDIYGLIPQRCSQHLSTLKEMLEQKEVWENYIDATYPELPGKLSTESTEDAAPCSRPRRGTPGVPGDYLC